MLVQNGSLRSGGTGVLKHIIIDNSDAIRANDAVKVLSGDIEVAIAGGAIFGIVIEIRDSAGLMLSSRGAPGKATLATAGGGTLSTTVTPPGLTVAADNETVDKAVCVIDLSVEAIYSGDIESSETMNTTVSSNKPGLYVDLADQRTVDETTSTRTITTSGQLFGWGVDPADSGNMLVSIFESSFYKTSVLVT